MRKAALESGQGLLEYALIFMLVVIIILVAAYFLGPGVGNMYSQVVPNL
jgi:pilus assembly protein Flp/PilA